MPCAYLCNIAPLGAWSSQSLPIGSREGPCQVTSPPFQPEALPPPPQPITRTNGRHARMSAAQSAPAPDADDRSANGTGTYQDVMLAGAKGRARTRARGPREGLTYG